MPPIASLRVLDKVSQITPIDGRPYWPEKATASSMKWGLFMADRNLLSRAGYTVAVDQAVAECQAEMIGLLIVMAGTVPKS